MSYDAELTHTAGQNAQERTKTEQGAGPAQQHGQQQERMRDGQAESAHTEGDDEDLLGEQDREDGDGLADEHLGRA